MYISEIIKKPVFDGTGKKIGKLKDAIVSSEISYPIIKAIIVDKADKKTISIPYIYIDNIGMETRLKTSIDEIKEYKIKNHDIRLW
ncbi:MAG: PRC-barrel domain-containing protein, partial [Methanobacterium sp.]|nr:PRC-barrel domain-containing protein [Methanobacterium sp.]